jgi:hypothetical protein
MKRLAKDLTDEEQDEFYECFYDDHWPSSEPDHDSPCPWGCPWYFGTEIILDGETIKDMAKNFYKDCEKEILELLKEEEEEYENSLS